MHMKYVHGHKKVVYIFKREIMVAIRRWYIVAKDQKAA